MRIAKIMIGTALVERRRPALPVPNMNGRLERHLPSLRLPSFVAGTVNGSEPDRAPGSRTGCRLLHNKPPHSDARKPNTIIRHHLRTTLGLIHPWICGKWVTRPIVISPSGPDATDTSLKKGQAASAAPSAPHSWGRAMRSVGPGEGLLLTRSGQQNSLYGS